MFVSPSSAVAGPLSETVGAEFTTVADAVGAVPSKRPSFGVTLTVIESPLSPLPAGGRWRVWGGPGGRVVVWTPVEPFFHWKVRETASPSGSDFVAVAVRVSV